MYLTILHVIDQSCPWVCIIILFSWWVLTRFLTPLTVRVMCAFCHHFAPVTIICNLFNILILFFWSTGPIGTKLGRNVHWMVFCFFFLHWSKYTKRNKRPKGVKKGFLFLYVEHLFCNQFWSFFFYMLLIKFSIKL